MEVQNQVLAPIGAHPNSLATAPISNLAFDSDSFDSSLFQTVTACRFCRFFDSTGRRGGDCSKLQSHVEGNWQNCSLAMPIFVGNNIDQSPDQIDIYPQEDDYFSPSFLPKLLPSMSPSMANILINSASTNILVGR